MAKRDKAKGNRFKDKVARNVEHQKQRKASYGHLQLQRGVNVFKEEPGGKCRLDFLLYEVTDEKHPDRDEESGIAVPGELWYRRPYQLHRNIGAQNDSAVCPGSVGNRCPVCEYRAKMLKEGASYQSDEVRALKPSQRNVYVVVPLGHKDYDEEPHIWDISQYNFQEQLNEELEEDEENMGFPDLDDGLTLRIRFTEEKLGGNTFAQTSRIDFEERDEQYGEEILKDVPNLDEVIAIPGYKELERLFLQIDEADDSEAVDDGEEPKDDDGDDDDDKPSRGRRGRRGKRAEPDDDDGRSSRRHRRGKRDEQEEEEEEPDDKGEGEEQEEEEMDDKPTRRGRRGKPKDDDGDDDDDGPARTTRRKKAGKKKTGKRGGKGKDEANDDGDRCPHGYRFGVDTDEYDECDKCPIWEECIEAKEEADK